MIGYRATDHAFYDICFFFSFLLIGKYVCIFLFLFFYFNVEISIVGWSHKITLLLNYGIS